MKKTGNLFIAIGIATLVLFAAVLVMHFTGFLVLDYWLMALTGAVLCIGYFAVPELVQQKGDYAPRGKHLYIWILLILYDLAFLGFVAFHVTKHLIHGA